MDASDLASLGILGVLAEEETATVERIRERLQHNFGKYWAGSYGVLLPTVSRLTEPDSGSEPAVERVESDDTYAITERGFERLYDLLREPIEDVANPMNYPQFALKLGFLHHLPGDDQRAELAALEDRFEGARNHYVELRDLHGDEFDAPRGYRRELFSLRAMVLDDHLQWLRSLRKPETANAGRD